MPYCRNCGKEINEVNPSCSYCNSPQFKNNIYPKRSVGKLIGLCFVWTCAFWVGSLFATGFMIGFFNPEDAEKQAEKAGKKLSGIFMLISLGTSAGLTITGKLPGTSKDD